MTSIRVFHLIAEILLSGDFLRIMLSAYIFIALKSQFTLEIRKWLCILSGIYVNVMCAHTDKRAEHSVKLIE